MFEVQHGFLTSSHFRKCGNYYYMYEQKKHTLPLLPYTYKQNVMKINSF